MHIPTFFTVAAGMLPIFLGIALAEDAGIILTGPGTPAADPVKLKARAVGSSLTQKRNYGPFSAMEVYNNVTAATHQTNFNSLSASGFRMQSLDVSGVPGNTRYAAVWVQTSGGAYAAIHEASQSAYQSFFNTYTSLGYVQTLLTAVGPGNNPVVAGVMEKKNVGNWEAYLGLSDGDAGTPGTFQYQTAQALASGLYPMQLAVYGCAGLGSYGCSYGVVYHANTGNYKIQYEVGDGASTILSNLNNMMSQGYYPYYFTGDTNNNIAVLYTNRKVNLNVEYDDDCNEWQTQFNINTAASWYPASLQVTDVNANARYWAIWYQSAPLS
ncbi:hypothetical protein MMC06_002197 [Schaereria dolodes]|nr:hypothetical protein [Schaereria dolodes]